LGGGNLCRVHQQRDVDLGRDVLLDFLLGRSVQDVATMYARSVAEIERLLRIALLEGGYDPKTRV
jgi:hypothetical protein